jgi:hypothetical protein
MILDSAMAILRRDAEALGIQVALAVEALPAGEP